MEEFDRRSALKLGLLAGVAAISIPGITEETEAQPVLSGTNPVLFWNEVSLELVALDHSIRPEDARAPGPCATARALGLVHAAIADAVYHAYDPPGYTPLFRQTPDRSTVGQEAFVGGAAAGILAHIFRTSAHLHHLETRREDFFDRLRSEKKDNFVRWQEGIKFSNPPDNPQFPLAGKEYTQHWNWPEIRRQIVPSFSDYIPLPRRHNIDPFNSDQGFYGQFWGNQLPLLREGWNVETLAPEPPPSEIDGDTENELYRRDLEEVRAKGQENSEPRDDIPARTTAETHVGLYWAYDGARLIGTPPRLYNQILRSVAVADALQIPQMARMFALCNLAMADASIVAWYAKYKYDIWRPVLGIQNRLNEAESLVTWKPLGAPKTNARGLAAPQPEDPAFLTLARIADEATTSAFLGAGTPPLTGNVALDFPSATVAAVAELEAETTQSILGAGGIGRIGAGSETGPEQRRTKPEPSFTPNFPAYPSGHATFGSTCFDVLRRFRVEMVGEEAADDIGDALLNFVSDELDGTAIDPRTEGPRPRIGWAQYPRIGTPSETPDRHPLSSLQTMIEHNGRSRVFLGVHWNFDSTSGIESGLKVAERVYRIAYPRIPA